MDQGHPCPVSPDRGRVCKRHERCGVGDCRGPFACPQPVGPPAPDIAAPDCRRAALHSVVGLPVARAAPRLSAVHDGAVSLLSVARSGVVEPAPRPTCRTVRARFRCSKHWPASIRPCASPLPTASIVVPNCSRPSPTRAPGPSRSSPGRKVSATSSPNPGDGSSNAPSPGWAETDASPRTTKPHRDHKKHGSTSPPSKHFLANSPEHNYEPDSQVWLGNREDNAKSIPVRLAITQESWRRKLAECRSMAVGRPIKADGHDGPRPS